jgi:hypothetical protein
LKGIATPGRIQRGETNHENWRRRAGAQGNIEARVANLLGGRGAYRATQIYDLAGVA